MSEEDQHVNKRSTGTVPKQRIRYTRSVTEIDRLRSLSNSSSDYLYHDSSYNELRSPRRSNQIVDTTFQAQAGSPVHASSIKLNSVGSSNPSTTTSRKNSLSSTLKCDNITKHPNKKQIEDKLNQIHDEYLKVTNSLMASIKKVDNQGIVQNDDLCIDSDYSSKKNDGNSNLENIGLNLIALKDLDPTSLLQRKSENKCLSPRHNRSNLLMEVCNHKNSTSNRMNRSDVHHDGRFNEIEEKNRKLQINPQLIPTQDKTVHNVESNFNDSAEQLFDMFDLNDTELEIQHEEFHKRIIDLQNKKYQIDQFLAQLQNSGANGEDVEHQVMKICAMKAQLKKLRNMLEFVKMPLSAQNSKNPPDYEKASCFLCSDNMSQNINYRLRNDSNIFRSSSNNSADGRNKQLNKMSTTEKSMPNVSSNNRKTSLQCELESKKRELVEMMGKHKVNPSNLNQDLGVDIKSDISFLMNGIHDPWVSVISNDGDSDKFSSDEYQNEINDEVKQNFFSLPSPSTGTNYHPTENLQRSNFEFRPVNRRSCTPDTNRSNSAGTTARKNKTQTSLSQDLHSNQMQQQLEIIRSICDSMLEHQNNEETYSNTQHFQNNDLNSSHNHQHQQQQQQNHQQQQRNSRRNSDNAANNSEFQRQWFPPSNPNSNSSNNSNNFRQDGNNASGYYNLLNTNNMQTQSFMLNTLNQCYQMLWMQQKELAALKGSVSTLQERFKTGNNFETTVNPTFASLHVNSQPSPNAHLQHHQQQQQDMERKINQDSAYTMPITNQFDCPMYFNSADNGNGNGNSQLLDTCLDNINLNRINVDQNSEHSLHANMNHLMPNHIWSGQALNNQVVPGNRANNYWDNFRSYSRQNLLSTKNNEVLQNLPSVVDRPNFINHCADPFAFMSFSKSNSEQDATNTCQDNSFQRIPFKETNPGINLGTQSTDSVININDAVRKNEEVESPSKDVFHKDTNSHVGLPFVLNPRTNHEDCTNDVPIVDDFLQEKRGDQILTDQVMKSTEESLCINSTFEDMKENIYKEVASLISANENRPQFLMQLFRDLQLVKSDNVRENVLHSIERNVYSSRVTAINASTQSNPATYLQITSPLDLTISCSSSNNNNNNNNNNEYVIRTTFLQEVQLFLNVQEESIIQNNFYILLKDFLLNLKSFKELYNVKSHRIRLANTIDGELQRFCGKKLGDVKSQLLQIIHDLVFVQRPLINYSGNGTNCNNSDFNTNTSVADVDANAVRNDHPTETSRTPLNGDLAEADQSGTASEDFAEEGAVGGILETSELKQSDTSQTADSILACSTNQTKTDSSTIDLCQPSEDSELLATQNNSLFLDHQ